MPKNTTSAVASRERALSDSATRVARVPASHSIRASIGDASGSIPASSSAASTGATPYVAISDSWLAASSLARGTRLGTAASLAGFHRSEEHTSELQSRENLVCRLLPEKKN